MGLFLKMKKMTEIKGVVCNKKIYPCVTVEDRFCGFYTHRTVSIDLDKARFDYFFGVNDTDIDEFDYLIFQAKKKALNLNCYAYYVDPQGCMKCIFSPKA